MVENMVKYYGAPGAKVGEYRSAKLGASFSREEFAERWGQQPEFVSPARDIHDYLTRAGTFVGLEREHDAKRIRHAYVYHYAGASVLVRFIYRENLPEERDVANVTLRLASNEPLDDLLERLTNKFPYLQVGQSFDDRI